MNNYRKIGWYLSAVAMFVLTLSSVSCTDDHFDISSAAEGKQTIWQNIQSRPDLSQYADILQSVYYSQSESKTTSETYAQLFDGDQTFTVWAPVNDSFDYAYYKRLLATGVRDSIYKVETQLIRNNMTRYSHIISGSDSIKLDLFNNKAAWLNNGKLTIKGLLISEPNVGASNGIIHITDGAMAYQPNLYEFLASRPDLDSINAFIKSYQTLEFNKYASTQGPTINGEVTWVDSVTYISNDYTSNFMNAYLSTEDSNYVMIVPTNTAWETVLAKTKNNFKYKATYKQDINTQTETGADTVITGVETKFTQAEIDSIVNLYSKNAICENLVFNANWQFERIPITSLDDIKAVDARQDSLLSTAGLKLKKTGTWNLTNRTNCVEIDDFANLFDNAEPIELSNGYAYIVNSFNFPYTVYTPNRYLEAARCYESCDNMCAIGTKSISYVSPTYSFGDETFTSDSTYRYDYVMMSNKNSTSHPGAFFMLPQVQSCKYDIFVVIGYNTNYKLPNKFRAYISYDTEAKRINNEALKNPNEDALDAKGNSITGSNFFVNKGIRLNNDGSLAFTDTICVAKDFEFPVSYYGLSNAYPVLQLKSNFSSTEKALYSREIWVSSIILKPKE